MIDVITDTGPLIHFSEITEIKLLNIIFNKIYTTQLIKSELLKYNISISDISLEIINTEISNIDNIPDKIHIPEYSLLELSKKLNLKIILTDDLNFRKHLISLGITPVGTIGILLKAYNKKIITKDKLINHINNIFSSSSLFISYSFKNYIIKKIEQL